MIIFDDIDSIAYSSEWDYSDIADELASIQYEIGEFLRELEQHEYQNRDADSDALIRISDWKERLGLLLLCSIVAGADS